METILFCRNKVIILMHCHLLKLYCIILTVCRAAIPLAMLDFSSPSLIGMLKHPKYLEGYRLGKAAIACLSMIYKNIKF